MPRRSSTPAPDHPALDTLTLGTLTRIVPRATVETVLRQHGRLLAHYAVRGVMHAAALQADEDPDRLSFTHTVRVLRRTLPQAAALPPSPVVPLVSERPG